jgi:hypothetical protein
MAKMVDSYCNGCYYHTTMMFRGQCHACLYIVLANKQRPCPPGNGCTEKRVGRKPKENIVIS